ncbi:MAG TPA: hypothetical protein VGE16_14935 [Albitalea sp.]
MTDKPFEFRPSGLIEFEIAEPEPVAKQAPAAVDDTLDHDPLSINFQRDRDSKPTAAERMLAGGTIDWLIAFPADARPKALCERYPHVANRLAKDWADRAQSVRSLQTLVDDVRWGSAGFPAIVQGELRRMLQRLAAA